MALKSKTQLQAAIEEAQEHEETTIFLSGCTGINSIMSVPANKIIKFIYEPSDNPDDPNERQFITTSRNRHFIISGEAYFEGFTFKSTMEPEDTSSPRAYGGFKIDGGTATFQSCNFVDIARAGDLSTDLGGIFSVVDGNLSVIGTLNNPESVEVNLAYPVESYAHGGFVAATGTSTIHLENLQITGSVDGMGGAVYAIDNPTVTLSNLTIADLTAEDSGGAIYQEGGSLSVADSTISGNYSNRGGGICMEGSGAILSIANTQITANTSNHNGGAIYLDNNVIATLTGVTIDTNAASLGAGIYSNQSQLILNQVEISNHTDWAVGGGIYMVGGSLLADSQTRIYENQKTTPIPSTCQGGGIYVDALSYPATLTLNGTQIDNNLAYAGAGIFLNGNSTANLNAANLHTNSATYGGGIYHNGTSLTLTNTTLEGNSVSQNGGGIYHAQGTLTVNGGAFNWNFANAEPSGRGGALYMKAGIATLQGDLQMTYNFAGQYGGAVAVIADLNAQTTANLTVTGNAQVGKIDGEYPAGNTAGQTGGGIYFDSAGTLTVSQNAKVEYNTATDFNGGGIAVSKNISNHTGAFQLQDNASVSYNKALATAEGTGLGGGIYLRESDGTVTITGGTIEHNESGTHGGGLYSHSSVTASDLLIDNNTSQLGNGGGIAVYGPTSTLSLTGGTLSNNKTLCTTCDPYGVGGAIYHNGTAHITDTTFTGNESGLLGGAIYSVGTLTLSGTPTFNLNVATISGGAIESEANLIIDGPAIFTENTAHNNGGAIRSNLVSGTTTMTAPITFQNNKALTGSGGAIFTTGTLTLNPVTEQILLTENTAGANGGAIYLDAPSTSSTLTNLTLTENTARNTGGALHIANGDLTANGCTFTENQSNTYGGAVMQNSIGNVNFTDCEFGLNKCLSDFTNGGAISNGDDQTPTHLTLIRCEIHHNTSPFIGGGLYNSSQSTVAIEDCHIHHNEAKAGGGLSIGSDNASYEHTITGTSIHHNIASDFWGGGLRIAGGTLHIEETQILENTAPSGGGISTDQPGSTHPIITLTNSALQNNIANASGGAIFLQDATLTATKSTLQGITPPEETDNPLTGNIANLAETSDPVNAENGGAIYLTNATLNLIGTEISNHSVISNGGGIYQTGSSTLNIEPLLDPETEEVTPTQIHHNNATQGGGIYSVGSTLNMQAAEIFSNVLTGYGEGNTAHDGGGILMSGGTTAIDVDPQTKDSLGTSTAIYDNTAGYNGGGFFITGGTLHMAKTNIYDNKSQGGGGFSTLNANVTATEATLTNNFAITTGGGISTSGTGTTSLIDSQLSHNQGTRGSGIYSVDVTLNLTNSTLTENFKTNPDTDQILTTNGGGILQSGGHLNIVGSEIATHNITGNGGAIYLQDAVVATIAPIIDPETEAITPTQIHHNTAKLGGGIYHSGGTVDIQNSELHQNTAHHGGAIYTTNYSNLTIDHDSTFTQNTADTVNNIVNPTDVAIYQDNVHVDPVAWSYQYPDTHDIAIGYNEADINEHDITVHYHIYDGAATPITGDIHYTDDFETALGQTAQNQLPNLEGLKLADRWYTDPECTTPFNFATGTYQDNLDLYTYDNVADDQETFKAIFNAVQNDSNDCHYSDALTDFDTILIRGLQDTSPSVPFTSPFQIQGQRLAVTLQNYYPEGGFITINNNFRHFTIYNDIDITFKNVQIQGRNGSDPTVVVASGGGINITESPTVEIIGDNTLSDFVNIANCFGGDDGGGIQMGATANLTVSGNLIVARNRATRGGGIRAMGNTTNTMTYFTMNDSVEIRNNVATYYGGGLALGRDSQMVVTATINGGLITENNTPQTNSNGGGGGIGIYGAHLTVNGDTEISHNSSAYGGGGIYLTSTGAKLTLNSGTITENTCTNAALGGGGLLIGSACPESIINGGIIENNHAPQGAGIFNMSNLINAGTTTNGTLTINGGTIQHNGFDNDNIEAQNGGGIYNRGRLVLTGGFIQNNGAQKGGGIYSAQGGAAAGNIIAVEATNATITNNIATTVAETGIGGGVYVETGTATFTTSEISHNDADLYGGGIYGNGVTVNLVGSDLSYNKTLSATTEDIYTDLSPGLGGGIHLRGNNSFLNIGNFEEDETSTATEIHHNEAQKGGGIFLSTALPSDGYNLVADGLLLHDNNAHHAVHNRADGGGGLRIWTGAGLIANSDISYNFATDPAANWSAGGGIQISSVNSRLTLRNTHLHHNEAGLGGGAYIIANATLNCEENTQIYSNKALSTGSDGGGGIEVTQTSTLNLTDTEIFNNQAGRWGGGLFVHLSGNVYALRTNLYGNTATLGGAIHLSTTGNIVNLTTAHVHDNTVTKDGGAIYQAGGTVTINDSNFHDNTAPAGRGGAIYTYNYERLDIDDASVFKNNSALNRNNQVTSADEAIYLDHVFVPDEEWSFQFPDAPVVAVGYNESDIQYPRYYINYLVYDGTEQVTGNLRITENFQTYLTETAEAQLQSQNPDIALCQTWFKDPSCTEVFDFQNGPYSDGMTLYSYDNVADDHGTFNGLCNAQTTGTTCHYVNAITDFDTILVRGNPAVPLSSLVTVSPARTTLTLKAYRPDGGFITLAPENTERHLEVNDDLDLTLIDVQFKGNNGSDALQQVALGGGLAIIDGLFTLTGANTLPDFVNITDCYTTTAGGGIDAWGSVALQGNIAIKNNRATEDGGGVAMSGALATTFTMTSGLIALNCSEGSGGGIKLGISHQSPPLLVATISGGTIDSNIGTFGGGGIQNNYADLTINGNVQITNNICQTYGAGMWSSTGSVLSITTGTFAFNHQQGTGDTYGGGGLCLGGACVATLTGGTFEQNTAQFGGGIWTQAAQTPQISNVTITDNTALNGGGFYQNANASSISNAIITENTASQNGGGIYNKGTVTVQADTLIAGNTAYEGGGIYMIDGAVTLQHTTIKNHAITGKGGAIYVANGSLTLNPDPNTNEPNEIHNNTVTKDGGAIYQAGGTVTINDSNFHHNTAPAGRGGAIYTYNYEKLDIDDASQFKNNSALNRNNQVTPADEAIYLDHVFVPDEEWSFAFPDAPITAVGYNESDIQYPLYYINYLVYDGTEEITGNVRFTENFQTYLTETAEAQLQSQNPDIALCQTWFKDPICTEGFDFQNGPYSDGMTLYSYDNVADDHGTFNGLFTGESSSVHAFANIFPVILVRGDHGFTLQDRVFSMTSRTVKLQAYDEMAIITSAVDKLHFQMDAPDEYEITFKNVQLSGQNNDATVDGVRGGGIDSSYTITLHLIGENDSDDFPNIANCNKEAPIQSTNTILSGNLRIENNRGQNGGGLRPYAEGNTIIKDQVKFIGNVSAGKGGAINIAGYDASYLTIQDDVQFIGNTALGDGGAVEISGGNIATINGNVQFIGNTGARGGAIRTSGTVTMSGNVWFEGNTANGQVDPYNSYSGAKGGAIYVGSNTVHIEDASFQTNTAVFGGAIYLDLDTTSVTVAGDTKFQGNVASLDGGGIFAEVYEELFIEQDVEFQNNTAHKNALTVTEAHQVVYASNVQASLWSLDTLHSPVNAQGYNNYDVNYANVTIHFESGGGSGSMPDQYVAVNEPTDLNPCTFYKLPCEFIGWDLAESPITTDTDVVLTAQWDCAELVCCEPAPDGEPGEQGPQGEPGTPIIPAALTAKILPETTNQFHFQALQKVGTAITLANDQFTIDEPGTYTVHWWLALHGTDNLQNTVTIQLAGQPVTSHQVSEHLSGMHHFQVGDEPLTFTLKTDDTVKVVDGAILIVR